MFQTQFSAIFRKPPASSAKSAYWGSIVAIRPSESSNTSPSANIEETRVFSVKCPSRRTPSMSVPRALVSMQPKPPSLMPLCATMRRPPSALGKNRRSHHVGVSPSSVELASRGPSRCGTGGNEPISSEHPVALLAGALDPINTIRASACDDDLVAAGKHAFCHDRQLARKRASHDAVRSISMKPLRRVAAKSRSPTTWIDWMAG